MFKDENWGNGAGKRSSGNGSVKAEDWLLDGMKPAMPAPSNGSSPRRASSNGAHTAEAKQRPALRRVPLPAPRTMPTGASEARIDAALAAFSGHASRVEANVRRAQDRVALAARRITDLDHRP